MGGNKIGKSLFGFNNPLDGLLFWLRTGQAAYCLLILSITSAFLELILETQRVEAWKPLSQMPLPAVLISAILLGRGILRSVMCKCG